MYEAVRPRAQISTRAAGLAITALLASSAIYIALTMGAKVVTALQTATTLATIDVAPKHREELPPPPALPDQLKLPESTIDFTIPPDIFQFDDRTAIHLETGPGPTQTHVDPPQPPHIPVRLPAKMKPGEPPPYPPTALRTGEEGISAISLCIDAKGRVTSASLARSSGHQSLDEAAVKWASQARFAPGTLDGLPQSACGQEIDYQWRIKTAR